MMAAAPGGAGMWPGVAASPAGLAAAPRTFPGLCTHSPRAVNAVRSDPHHYRFVPVA